MHLLLLLTPLVSSLNSQLSEYRFAANSSNSSHGQNPHDFGDPGDFGDPTLNFVLATRRGELVWYHM